METETEMAAEPRDKNDATTKNEKRATAMAAAVTDATGRDAMKTSEIALHGGTGGYSGDQWGTGVASTLL